MDQKRITQVVDLYAYGWTQKEIAKVFDVTYQRIGQILKGAGLNKKSGGASLRTKKADIHRSVVAERYFKRWGITRAEGDAIKRRFGSLPFKAFAQQKKNCGARGILMEMTFAQWWSVWTASGRWSLRGRGKYVMTRIADRGNYAVGNVVIKTQSENTIEYHAFRQRLNQPRA